MSKLEELGLTRNKAILIGILGTVFIGVLVTNLMPASNSPSAGTLKRRKPRLRSVSNSKRSNNKQSIAADVKRKALEWPEFKLADVITHDPFALPAALRPEKEEATAETNVANQTTDTTAAEAARTAEAAAARLKELQLAQMEQEQREQELKMERVRELQKSGIGIALISPDSKVIKIGEKKFQVGDMLQGLRIVEIRPDGSVVVSTE